MAQDNKFVCLYCGVYHGPCCGIYSQHLYSGFLGGLRFLLGGIVSPPDAVSAAAIMKFVKVPRRISAILEGESLFNDASSLIIVKFALIAIGTGQFVWYQATASFIWMVIGGAGVGVLLSYAIIKLHKWLHKWLPIDENINTMFTIFSPYVMYIAAETVEASGVLAVVSGGFTSVIAAYKSLARRRDCVPSMCGTSLFSCSMVWHFCLSDWICPR